MVTSMTLRMKVKTVDYWFQSLPTFLCPKQLPKVEDVFKSELSAAVPAAAGTNILLKKEKRLFRVWNLILFFLRPLKCLLKRLMSDQKTNLMMYSLFMY